MVFWFFLSHRNGASEAWSTQSFQPGLVSLKPSFGLRRIALSFVTQTSWLSASFPPSMFSVRESGVGEQMPEGEAWRGDEEDGG